jgi:hypothetical protein
VAVVRYFDFVVLALALPVFIVADFPIVGYLTAAATWSGQRAIQAFTTRRAAATSDPRTVVGLMAGSMIGRGWLVAGAIFIVGVADSSKAGLSAAVLFIALFTVYFTVNMILRPFDTAPPRPSTHPPTTPGHPPTTPGNSR